MDWTLSKIRTKVRKLTGRPSTQQMSDAVLDEYINQFYQNEMPTLTGLEDFVYWWEMTTTDGQGEYGLDADMIAPMPLCWLDTGDGYGKMWLTQDHELFFANYPPAVNDETDEEGKPAAALLWHGQLYLRPVPDASTYKVKLPVKGRPQALSADGDSPIDATWGPAIAFGAAAEIKVDDGDQEGAEALGNVLTIKLSGIGAKDIYRNRDKRAHPKF